MNADTELTADISQPCWAQVSAAGFVIRYRRRGTGRAIMLLEPDESLRADGSGLVLALSGCGRVIVPVAPEPDGRFTLWMRAFLEGLGVPAVSLVASAGYCVPSLEFALLESDRLDNIVLIHGGISGEPGDAGTLAANAPRLAMPVLVVGRDSNSDPTRLIVEFLGRGQPAQPAARK